jgi:hypothetical protein
MKANLFLLFICLNTILSNAFTVDKIVELQKSKNKIDLPIHSKYTINKVERTIKQIEDNSKKLLLILNKGIKNLKLEEESDFNPDIYDDLKKIKNFISIFSSQKNNKNHFNISYNEELNNFKTLEQNWYVQRYQFYNNSKLNSEFSQALSIYKLDIRFFSKLISEEYRKL